MSPTVVLLIYCVLVTLASLAGGWLPQFIRLTHERMNLIMSFVAGVLLGMGLWHMLPHAAAATDTLDQALFWMMMGVLVTFLLTRTLAVHQHGQVEPAGTVSAGHGVHDQDHTHAHDDHGHHPSQGAAGEAHAHLHRGEPDHVGRQKHTWIALAYGMSLHTLIDGVALAAGVEADALHPGSASLVGFGTFLAILLHKPLDAMSITTVMAAGGWSKRSRHLVNGLFALICPIGALVFAGIVTRAGMLNQELVIACALAFAAGVFVCIALGDLLPELHFHPQDRLKLAATLLFGVLLTYGIGFFEGAHVHGHPTPQQHEHEHDHEPHAPPHEAGGES